MATLTYPTLSEDRKDAQVADLRPTVDVIRRLPQSAKPTLRVLMSRAKRKPWGQRMKITQDMFVRAGDAFIGTIHQNFTLDSPNLTTTMEWDPKIIGASKGISVYERESYTDSGVSQFDKAMELTIAAYEGCTTSLNFSCWAGFNTTSTNTEGTPGAEAIGGEISLDSFDPANPGNKITGAATEALRYESIPFAIRNYSTTQTNAYTYGGISISSTTDNVNFQSKIIEGNGSTITYGTSGRLLGIPTRIQNPETFSKDLLEELLQAIQVGPGYELLIAMPPAIYSSAVDVLFPQMRGTADRPLKDLGINASVTWEEYNAILYADPTLTSMWPTSIWAWDTSCLFLCLHPRFAPYVWPWQSVGFSTDLGFSMAFWGNLINVCPPATGVIHGVQAA